MMRVINIKAEMETSNDLEYLEMESFCTLPDESLILKEEPSKFSSLSANLTNLEKTDTVYYGHLSCRDYMEENDHSSYIIRGEIPDSIQTRLPTEIEEVTEYHVNQETGELIEEEEEKSLDGALECRWEGCWWLFHTRRELVVHIENQHIERVRRGEDYPCLWKDCPRRYHPFNARYKLLIHMRVHSGDKPNKCPYSGCLKAFSRVENLKIHQRSHTGERPYLCQFPTCRKAFSNSSDRAKHHRTHIHMKPYACQAKGCGKKYTDPSSLRKHVKMHGQGLVPYTPKKLIASEPIVTVEELQSRGLKHTRFSAKEENTNGKDSTWSQDFDCSLFGSDDSLSDTLDSDVEREFLEDVSESSEPLLPMYEEDLFRDLSL